jgi:phosphatidate cytidylyltransferase
MALASYIIFVFFNTINTKTDLLLTLATLFVSANLIIDLFVEKFRPKEDKIAKFDPTVCTTYENPFC